MRRVWAELVVRGVHVTRKRVWRLMQAAGLQGRHPRRGLLDRDGLAALILLAHVGVRRGYRELVLDVHGLTDFPSALFAELRKLADVAGRSRCRLRLDGLDAAIAAAVAAACRGDDAPRGGA